MSANQTKYPQLRFKGFTDSWEQRKLGAITDSFSGGTPTAGKAEYYGGEIPFIRSGELSSDSTELFITDAGLNNSSAKMVGNGDILYALYGATSGETSISRINGAINQAILAIRPTKGDDPYMIVQWLKKQKETIISTYLQGGQGNLSGSIVKDLLITLPKNKDEQAKVGSFFKQLDQTITLHQRKLAKLKELKQGYLQKLFPENGSKFPQLRFAGFADAWEQRKFGELYKKNLERNKDHFSSDRTISIATMRFKKEGNGAAENSLVSYKVLREGDIAFEGHTSKRFAFGRFVLNDIGDGIMSPRFTTLRPTQDMPIKFWKQYIHYEPIMRYPIVNSTKLGTMMNELVVDEFLNQPVLVPELSEQEKIGSFFQQLDETIALHQRKLEKLQELKKGYLQKMFC